ncbi:MAG TPA: hypothetical protein VGJ82_15575 [Thermoanaerobaculia bacterium]
MNLGEPGRINLLNIALMLFSCAVAFALPFQLFLFAYAVLGPLHYLTEISWLHDRGYFASKGRGRRWWLALVAITVGVLLLGYATDAPPKYEIGCVYLVFFTALMLHFVRHAASAVALALVTAGGIALASTFGSYFVIAYLLVTIIHVFVFTAVFVLHGALRTRSWSAMASLGVMIACAVSFFLVAPVAGTPPAWLRTVYGFFAPLNTELLRIFGYATRDVFGSRGGAAVMRFIAFAYTYHYLNWFSKTSIIKWHEVSRSRAIAIVALWIAALATFAYDYSFGVSMLYALSLLHVMLEFPLNHRTVLAIVHPSRVFPVTAPARRRGLA